jgi:pimeloyl-ACP methyl ester carboxylesterase
MRFGGRIMNDIMSRIPPEGHFASVNGMDMYYEIHGDGSPLILLHGFTGCTDVWESHVGELAKHYRTLPIDLRGHGWSTNPAGGFTHRQCALDIFVLLDQLGIDRFKGIGHSSGSMILIHMATQQPERVEAMILVGSASYIPEQTRAIYRQTTVENPIGGTWEELRERQKHGDAQIRVLMRQFHDMKDSYDDMNFTPPYLSTISARTLIVHGDRDAFFPVSIPAEMYRAIPHSYLWIVPNGGHLAPDNHSDKFAALFIDTALEFLRGDWDE